MSGRNWTRRSIEELIDEFLKKKGGVTPAGAVPGFMKPVASFGTDAVTGYFRTYYPLYDPNDPTQFAKQIDMRMFHGDFNLKSKVDDHRSEPLIYNTRTAYWDLGLISTGYFLNLMCFHREDTSDELTDHIKRNGDRDSIFEYVSYIPGFHLCEQVGISTAGWTWAYAYAYDYGDVGEIATPINVARFFSNHVTFYIDSINTNPPVSYGSEIYYLSPSEATQLDGYWQGKECMIISSQELTSEQVYAIRSNIHPLNP